jgi:hypothetical protein
VRENKLKGMEINWALAEKKERNGLEILQLQGLVKSI